MQKLKFKSHDQGVATHMVAAFAGDLDGTSGSPLCFYIRERYLTVYSQGQR